MASLSFRDRFFSPPVARALTSPSGILATGGGAAVGLLLTAPLTVPLAVIGAGVGAAAGLGARLAVALPKKGQGPKIDPFAVNEPWRAEVLDAVRARARFAQALRTFRSGPLQDSLAAMDAQLDTALDECWRIAQQGQLLADARAAIDDRQIRAALHQAATASPTSEHGADIQTQTVASLEAQLASAERMDALITRTRDELGLLNTRLDESVTQAVELSVSNQSTNLVPLGAAVDDIVNDLEALRLAMDDVSGPGAR